ncbi:TonB-dependent receptor [Pseudidiomarina atlantica]|jgi:outer membrane receptor protein involved in Fe transport|uniref:TonB-dependent receptor n=1 Tax=Pseudidiomarina atlantica TaxID=1517416 RepID=A0A094IS93_9GAMM|nr:TonB-dependent receptor [Pseudidiomarina atlantica]KFZ28709.1 TonB-dependent receptor [Pseudidiomarina atlantica]
MIQLAEELKLSRLALALGCVFAASSGAVHAQDTGDQDDDNNAEEVTEKIQVTGSRIRTDGLDQASPVEIISSDEAVDQGLVTLGDLLRTSTVAAGSNQITAAASTAFVTEGGTGTETLSLRGLGANRTLVLLNGRRIGPAGTRGQVNAFDLNIMPLAAIERVEILKDGASSLYGSDAVAGVVNIITKDGDESNFNVNYSHPFDDGGASARVNGTLGRSFDSGSFRIVGDYQKTQELTRGDRDFFACASPYVIDPSTGDRADIIDPRTGTYHCNDLPWGHVWIYDYSGLVPPGTLAQYDYDGDLGNYLTPFNEWQDGPGAMRTPEGWYPVGFDQASDALVNADHPFQDLETLSPETEVATAFLQGEYWMSDTTTLYGEVLLNRRKTISNGYRQFWSYIYNEDFFAGNTLSEGWTGAQWLSPTAITDHSGSEITVDYRRFVVGLEGMVGDWNWDVNYQSSYSDGEYQNKIIYQDAIFDQNFLTGSCEGMELSVRGIPCQDIPWLDPQFLAGNISQGMKDFLFGEETGNTIYKQETLEGLISGQAYDLPAGPIGMALGMQWQSDEIVDTPGDVTLARNAWGSSAAGITRGKSTTKAFFGEFQLPILRDAAFAERLDVSLSGRWTDVSTYGSDTTFKASVNWLVGEGFRIRGSRGTSFRSPALYELFLNDQSSFIGQRSIDPCIRWGEGADDGSINPFVAANCEADGIPRDYAGGAISATVFTGGGFGQLEAETSVAETFGFVWIPDFTEFSMSVDYFDIQIDGEVTLLSAAQIVGGCYASENFSTEPLCDQFFRNETDLRVEEVEGNYLNIASQTNRGVDLQFNYPFSTDFAEFNVRYEHTIQIEASRKLLPTSTPQDRVGELGSPKHVGNLSLAMMMDDWSYNWTTRMIGSASNHDEYGGFETSYYGETVLVDLDTPTTFYHAISATRDWDNLSLTFGVANAFDKEPPQVSSVYATTIGTAAFYSQYDWFGRRAFVNLTYQF